MKLYTLPLEDLNATLETVGGKGMSLAKMINAGLPVPGGFHITTEAYRTFIETNNLQTKIHATLKGVDTALPALLETASATIGTLFAEASIPNEITNIIRETYLTLDTSHVTLPVAVRSSATARCRIPLHAVLATGVATRRIQDGWTITFDGSAGIVSLLN